MMLCQKQPQFSLYHPSAHRRLPSAPSAVVVQPTRTPGLLSLSKPSRPSPHRQQQQQQHIQQQRQSRTVKPKHVLQSRSTQAIPSQSSQINDDDVSKPVEPVEAVEKKQSHTQSTTLVSLSSTDKGFRGRQQGKPLKDKPIRSVSVSSSRGLARRNNNRQPSPPIQPGSQTEGTSINNASSHKDRNPASNLFDPFLVNSASDTDSGSDSAQPQFSPKPVALRPAPTLSSPPSGKLAHRRQHIPGTPTPTPSKVVPVPRSNRHRNNMNLSRSDPVLSHMPVRPNTSRTAVTAPAVTVQWDAFPICDDMTDAGSSPSATPVKGSSLAFDGGPHTAPLMRASAFPFGGFSTPSPTPRARGHRRTPSEGVFDMSFDEDSDSSEELKGLPRRRTPSGSVRANNKDKAGYFASSIFQNSPNPEELPPPSF